MRKRYLILIFLLLSLTGCAGLSIDREQTQLGLIKANTPFLVYSGLLIYQDKHPTQVDSVLSDLKVVSGQLKILATTEKIDAAAIFQLLIPLREKLESEIADLSIGKRIAIEFAILNISNAIGYSIPTDGLDVDVGRFRSYILAVADGMQEGLDLFERNRVTIQNIGG